MTELPSHARVVVIGGGAVGCSALYHLARRGWRDCVLLEMDELTSGSTWHAAGNCPNFSGSWGIMKLQRYSTRLYAGLAEETGYPINYHVTGAVRLAQDRERMDEFRHVTAMARHQGIDFAMLTPAEIKQRYPFIELHGLAGGQWDPLDGDIDPAQLTQALARGARDAGARIVRFCRVTGLAQRTDGAWRVATDQGEIVAEIVVNAAGYRAAEIGAMVGRIPTVAMSHQYLVTADIPELAARADTLPLLRDPVDSYYLRQEGKGLLLGPYEWKATSHWPDGVPERFAFQLPDDLERLERHIELACGRVPILGSVGIKKVINGPIPYTPDGNPLIGPAPGLRNFFEALRLLLRHRAGRRRGQDARRLGDRGRARMGSLVARSAPLHRACHADLHARQGDRTLSARIRDRLPLRGATRRSPRRRHRRCTPASLRAARCSARATAGSVRSGSRATLRRRNSRMRSRCAGRPSRRPSRASAAPSPRRSA